MPASSTNSTENLKSTSLEFFRKLVSFPAFLGVLLMAGVFIGRLANMDQSTSTASGSTIYWIEGDTWWHIAIGNFIVKFHQFPTHDIYSFTARGVHWIAYEWAGEVLMALAWRTGGLHALMILLTALAWAIMLLLYYYSTIETGNSKAAFVACAVLVPLVSATLSLRPELLGYALIIVILIILKKYRQGNAKILWALPAVFLIWINVHGTFVLGFAILGIYWLSGLRGFRAGGLWAEAWTQRQRVQIELVGLISVAVLAITPYGTQLAAYPLEMMLFQPLNLQSIQEWQAIDVSQIYGKLFLALILLLWIWIVGKRPALRLETAALLLIATAETFLHARFLLLFVPVFAPVLAEMIAPWFPKYHSGKDRYALNFALMALIGFGIFKIFPSQTQLQRQVARQSPVGAVQYLHAHSGLQPTFNNYDWGGYLMLTSAPEHKTFIDGRMDIYEYAGVMADYLDILHLQPDTPFLLDKYRVRSCLVRPGGAFATLLGHSSAWKQVYGDSESLLYARKPTSEAGIQKQGEAKVD